ISPLGSSAERPHLAPPPTHFTARLVRRAASPRTAADPFHRSARPPSGLTSHRRRPVSPLGSSAERPHLAPPSDPFHRSARPPSGLTSHRRPTHFTARLVRRAASPRTAVRA